jgi:hypothetical protein
MAGVVVHAKTSEEALLRSGELSVISASMARVQGFLSVFNTIVQDGKLKAYHTDVIGRYATVLDESQYHVIVDITKTA